MLLKKNKLQTGFSHFDLFSVEVLKLSFLQKRKKKPNSAQHLLIYTLKPFTLRGDEMWAEVLLQKKGPFLKS